MAGWVAGLFGNITNSAPNWVGLGLGLSLAIIGKNYFNVNCSRTYLFFRKQVLHYYDKLRQFLSKSQSSVVVEISSGSIYLKFSVSSESQVDMYICRGLSVVFRKESA